MNGLVQLAQGNPIVALILACELGLWVLLGLGLVARYLLRLRTASTLLLAAIPLLDVVLVVVVTLDLLNGAQPKSVHGLAGVYLGFSVAFGPSIVRWADVRFAHRFAGGPAPVKPTKGTLERVAHLWREWNRVVTAAGITSVVLGGLVLFVATPEQSGTLTWWIGRVWVVVGIWLVAGPLWESGGARAGAGRRQRRLVTPCSRSSASPCGGSRGRGVPGSGRPAPPRTRSQPRSGQEPDPCCRAEGPGGHTTS